MNWLKIALTLLQLAPVIVQGVSNIASEKDHETKRKLASDALLLASGVAAAVDPKDTDTITQAAQLANTVINIHMPNPAAAASAS
jgi:dihydroxyacetone kinase